MNKFLIIFLVVLLISAAVFSASTVPVGIVYTKNGVLTTPDSIRIDMEFYPSLSDTTFKVTPSSGIWDSLYSITSNVDKAVNVVYKIYSGADTAYGSEIISLRLDTASFKPDFWRKLALHADSGSIANAGLYVWAYSTKIVDEVTSLSLSGAERAAIADSARARIERDGGFLWNLVYFWASCDGCYTVYFPDDGTSPKDSVVIYDALGVVQTVIKYKHSNNNAVLDTANTDTR